MFGKRNRPQPTSPGNGPFITHNITLSGTCRCGTTVTKAHSVKAILGQSGWSEGYVDHGCGNSVLVREWFG